MSVFSVKDREDAAEYIKGFTERHEHIVSLVAIGSGAYGYNDELSDVDFVVAIDEGENLGEVMDYVAGELRKKYSFIYFKQVPERRLQVFICDNYLEIDVGYGPYTQAAAIKKDFRVLFDKSSVVEEKMRGSWDYFFSKGPGEEAVTAKLRGLGDAVWHSMLHGAMAIKRGQYFRAASELGLIRNTYIELVGLRRGLETARGREIDKFGAEELALIKASLVLGLEPQELWAGLFLLIDAVYTELESYGERAGMQVGRAHIMEFAEHCKSL